MLTYLLAIHQRATKAVKVDTQEDVRNWLKTSNTSSLHMWYLGRCLFLSPQGMVLGKQPWDEWAVRNGVCMGFCHSCQKKPPPPTDFVRALHPVNHGLWTMVCGGGNLQCCVVIWFLKYNPWFLVLKIIQNPRTAAFQFQFFFFLTKNQNPRIVFCNYLRNIKAPTVIKMGYLFI